MRICIIDMDMPKECMRCPLREEHYGYWCLADKNHRDVPDCGRPSWCPVHEAVPYYASPESFFSLFYMIANKGYQLTVGADLLGEFAVTVQSGNRRNCSRLEKRDYIAPAEYDYLLYTRIRQLYEDMLKAEEQPT